MTELQLRKLGKIFRLASSSMAVNVTINIHDASKQGAREIIKGIPRGFRKKSKITVCGSDWTEATKRNVYGLSHLEVTVFYPKKKGGEK